jgi:poly-gamma-glutamate capsule biosynthesis protein CapA/YwtB (metallophosphatase superfamily)
MLGRGVAEKLTSPDDRRLFSDDVVDAARAADLFLLNLECCISERGSRWADPRKPFFFRAPPSATQELKRLGVDCVTLANNHALDFGHRALLDTFDHLDAAGIRWVGAGPDVRRARAPEFLEAGGVRLAVLGVTDHPEEFSALPDRPGVAFADLRAGVPEWTVRALESATADITIVLPHWGPNMNPEPLPYVLSAAAELIGGGAGLVAGHSAHVFQGVSLPVLFDMGDFVDDYAIDPVLRNDLGLLFTACFDDSGLARVEALPLHLGYCYTSVAAGEDARWIRRRFAELCRRLGETVAEEGDKLVVLGPRRRAD